VIARLKKAIRDWSGPLTAESPEIKRLFAGEPNSSRIDVNEYTALNYSAFWAATSTISGDVSSLPLIFYKRLKGGGKERYTDHPLYKVLHDEPNPEMSSMAFREAMQAHVLIWGNAYAEIERDAAARPVHLWPLTPDRVSVQRTSEGVTYRVRSKQGSEVVLPARDVLHIPGLGFDGLQGYSVVAKARESLGLGLATERFGGSFFGNGSTFGGILTHPQTLGDEAAKSLRESVNSRHTGVENAHRFMILEEGMSYQALGVPPNEAQFLETRKFQITEIARWFSIPVSKLREMDNSSVRANIEHEALDYLTSTLRRWLVKWEQEINRKLISPRERGIQFAEHLVDGLLRGDAAARNSAYAIGRQWGYLCVDDIRELENLNPLPDGAGKIFLVPSNMMPADRINEVIDAQVREPEPPPAPVAPPAKESDEGERAALHAQIAAQAETIRAFADKMEAAAAREAESAATVATLRQELSQAEQGCKDAGAQIEGLRAKLGAAQSEIASLEYAIGGHDAQADDARALANEQEQRAIKAEAALALAQERDANLSIIVTEMGQKADALRQDVSTLEADLAKALGDMDASSQRADDMQAAANQQEQRAVKAEAQMIEHAATIQQMGDQAEYQAQRMAALEADLAEARERHGSDAIEIGDANAKCALAITAQAAADKRAGEAVLALADEREMRQGAERALEDACIARDEQKDAEAQRITAMLTIQRAMAADVVRKLVDVECTRARRHQADKHKLRSWMDQYYATSEDVFYDALLPIARLHAACVGGVDPEVQARELARAHVAESQAQLRAVLESEDFHEDLDRTLRRWEVVRHEDTADKLLRDGIASVRAL
jgi:HK97 family phage portal protein